MGKFSWSLGELHGAGPNRFTLTVEIEQAFCLVTVNQNVLKFPSCLICHFSLHGRSCGGLNEVWSGIGVVSGLINLDTATKSGSYI